MSSVIHAARASGLNQHDVLGGWGTVIAALIILHVGALIVWILLWTTESLRGGSKGSVEKQD
jgi:hypothetical protein